MSFVVAAVVAVVACEVSEVAFVDVPIVVEGEVVLEEDHLAHVEMEDGMQGCCEMWSFFPVRRAGFWYARDDATPWLGPFGKRTKILRELGLMTPGSGTEFVRLNHAPLV